MKYNIKRTVFWMFHKNNNNNQNALSKSYRIQIE